MGNKWVTKRTKLKDKWNEDPAKVMYEVVCVLLIVAAIIYSVITGTAPDNSGF